ncbi:hypothetical protein Pan97_31430 [Bremerella volcania]|uniref:Alginate export domain-containing protein n=1 Tax=Bremerella volcania TaxID=2527984 RepID=A0A518CA44_9BACT|nr:hypothetical protein [Bremerella volcania]QDU76098.1 hypothetical protein Pan97_31430 [Bremerella volcania]
MMARRQSILQQLLASTWCSAILCCGSVVLGDESLFAEPPASGPGERLVRLSIPHVEYTNIGPIHEWLLPPLAEPIETPLETPHLLPLATPENANSKAWKDEPLPPLDEELWEHGGSYLYAPEGDRLGWPCEDEHADYELLRLPEDYIDPEPFTLFTQFEGEEPIKQYSLDWFGPGAYNWEPRFVAYGGYQVSAIAFKQGNTRNDGLGHQLLVDLDLRLTGTERFHLQFRPIGDGNTGGSYYRFSDPAGYIDNSTGEPQRFWFEGELHSMFSGFMDPFAVRDLHMVGGKFPFQLHNQLLMNDEILGAVINKNTLFVGNTSNVNIQAIYAASDVDNVADASSRMYGTNVSVDYKKVFYEGSYLYVETPDAAGRDQHFAAISRTQFHGRLNYATRALFKFGDEAGTGSGELFVLETNYTYLMPAHPLGIESGVAYCNVFYATDGWNSAAGGNFNRLRAAFDVNPLVAISTGTSLGENYGASLGIQLFRHHEDESIAPEIAFQTPNGDFVYGFGLRYQRKTGKRTFFEVLGVLNLSDNEALRRDGVFVSETILF